MSTFLTGEQPVKIVRPANRKSVRLRVEVPAADMATLGEGTGEVSGSVAGPERWSSIWPDVAQRILALVGEHRSTIVFANSRRPAERLTARLNELVAEPAEAGQPSRPRRSASPGSRSAPRRWWPARTTGRCPASSQYVNRRQP